MTEEKEAIQSSKRIMSEARGRYTVFDDSKVYHFDFPASGTLAMNYDIVSYMKDEIFKAMETQKKKEEEEKNCKSCDCE